MKAWMPWYPSDYMRDTLELNLEEDAIYRRALDYLWQNQGVMPRVSSRLCRCLRISENELERCKWVLEKYLVVDGDFYRNERLDEEREKALHRYEIAVENGKKGGRPKTKVEAKENPEDNQTLNQNDNQNHNPEKSSPQSQPQSQSYSQSKPQKNLLSEPKTFSDEVMALTELLISKILSNYPTCRLSKSDELEKARRGWPPEIDLLIRRDHRTPEQVRAVIEWCQQDIFWKANIRSTSKLREKWDDLVAKMQMQREVKNEQYGPKKSGFDEQDYNDGTW